VGRIRVLQYHLLFGCLLFGLLWRSVALADQFITQTAQSARAVGMGDAAINTERGPYSVFYNPANLAAKDTGVHIQLLNFQVESNGGLITQAGRGASTSFNNLSSLYEDLRTNPNTYVNGRVSVFPNITIRNLHLGILYEVNQGAEVQAHDLGLRVKARNRFAPTAALSFRVFNGIFRFGFSSQLLTIGDADTVILPPISSGNLDFKRSINAGTGLVHTGGITLTLPVRFLPSFSGVYRNIGTAKFTRAPMVKFGDGRTIENKKPIIDLASSFTVYLAKRLETKWEIDFRDSTNRLKGNKMQHISFGTEWLFFDLLRLRGGVGHGYYSAGLGLHTPRAQMDLAWYSDELDNQFRSRRDQRVVLQYTWGIFK